ncbi:MAG TPA: DUF6136 family protein [Steroidobacteraceae bacterium]|nr:DUF6136 family protein [Steroidobacteraceae bacterium]
MTSNYLAIRHAHFRITLRSWLQGIDKALIAIAAALTFILTAIVAMLVYGMAQALAMLPDPATPAAHRIAVITAWQGLSFILLRALREAALMPKAAPFFDSLPVPAAQKLRADAVLALLSYSFLWLPVGWALIDPLTEQREPATTTVIELGALVVSSVAVNLTALRGRLLHAGFCALALAALAWPAVFRGIEGMRALCACLAGWALWMSYQPGAARAASKHRRSAFAGALALRSGLVVPLLANELRANLLMRVGAVLGTLASCLIVIGLRTNDTSGASVLLFVAATATLAFHSLPALIRSTLLARLGFLAGQAEFTRRMRNPLYLVPTAMFCAALLAGRAFDRGGRTGLEAGIFCVLYALGVAGARLDWGVTRWFMPFTTMLAVIILGAMT